MKTPFIFAFALCSQAFCDSFDGDPVPYLTDTAESKTPYTENGNRGDSIKKKARENEIKNWLNQINKPNQKAKNIKLNTHPFRYKIESAGVDEKGYICGRITIIDASTENDIGVYDYKSLLEGRVSNNEPFDILVKKRGEFKEEKWNLTRLYYNFGKAVFLLSIPDKNFNDLIEINRYSTFEGRNNKTPIESIKEIRESGHSWLPKSMPPDDDATFKKYKDGYF